MASHLLSTITITTTTGNWTAGDKITTFFDTVTLLVSANVNGSPATSGDPLIGTYVQVAFGVWDSSL